MKQLLLLLLLAFACSCHEVEDDTGTVCTNNCTTLSGKFVSLNGQPVEGVKVSLKYFTNSGNIISSSTRRIVNVTTDENGNYYRDFYIQDSELGVNTPGYFSVEFDDSALDNNHYIKTSDNNSTHNAPSWLMIFDIMQRDTIINNNYYIPKKAHVTIHLNNFVPQEVNDYFEVRTLYPFGREVGYNETLDSYYGTGSTGTGTYKATSLSTTFSAVVAEGERNIIRVLRRKNSENSYEDFPIPIPTGSNNIELSYDY